MTLGLAIASFGLSPTARAVDRPSDRDYPGASTAEGDDALFSLTTVSGDGVNNTAMGWQAFYSNTIGNNNTAVGTFTLLAT